MIRFPYEAQSRGTNPGKEPRGGGIRRQTPKFGQKHELCRVGGQLQDLFSLVDHVILTRHNTRRAHLFRQTVPENVPAHAERAVVPASQLCPSPPSPRNCFLDPPLQVTNEASFNTAGVKLSHNSFTISCISSSSTIPLSLWLCLTTLYLSYSSKQRKKTTRN